MIESLFLGKPADPTSRMIQEAMKDYFTLKNVDEAEHSIAGGLFGSGLDRQNQELDIALKKRQLQMLGPQDTEEFNDTPASSVLAALGITWAKDLQPPKVSSGFQAAKDGPLMRALMGESLGSNIPYMLSKELGHGGSGNIGRLARSLF